MRTTVGLGAIELGHVDDPVRSDERRLVVRDEQQRVAIARALANSPQLVLADEPCASLDARTANEVLAIFLTVCRQEKKTLLLVSHDEAALFGADRVIDMTELNRTEADRWSA